MTPTRQDVLWFLMVETLLFLFATIVHRGILFTGYEHAKAALAELVLAIALGGGLVYTVVAKAAGTRLVATITQVFALLGVFAGLATIVTGTGPKSTPDLIMYVIMLVTLVLGLAVTRKAE